MSALAERQHQFSKLVPLLLNKAFELGYEVTILECKRSQKQADANAAAGIGIKNSLHLISLAVDLALFKKGIYLTAYEDYLELGKYWENIGGTWGGRFSNPDSDHFSLSFNGVK